jgi:hypothetical protein
MHRLAQSGYKLFVETLGNGAGRAQLFDPERTLVGTYIKPTPGECVESACSTLRVLGAPDDARALQRQWDAIARSPLMEAS